MITPSVFMYEKALLRTSRTKSWYCQTKGNTVKIGWAGKMNYRKSECLDSTNEVGELYNLEESMEGSEASEF